MNKKTSLILSILGIISVVLITVGITYAFFNYAKEGTTDNIMQSGSITFIYEEVDKQGAGIFIENAYPMLDENGKVLASTNEVFNFKIKSTTGTSFAIPYVITARKDSSSTLNEKAVRIYLTEVDGDTETEILLDNYSELPQTDIVSNSITERIIHTDTVPQGSSNYEKNYRLRMWVDSDIDFSPDENDNYEYNNKTFKLTVNVYADAEVVTVPTKPTTMDAAIPLSIGDSVTAIDGSKWHVLEASAAGTETVVLLSDYNLNTDGTYNTTCGKNIDGNYFCNDMAFDSDNTSTYDETDSNNVGYLIKNQYEPKVTKTLTGTTDVTLPTAQQIATADGVVFQTNGAQLSSPWLLTTTYWTKSSYSATDVWCVAGTIKSIYNVSAEVYNACGTRPVITTPKTNLLAE